MPSFYICQFDRPDGVNPSRLRGGNTGRDDGEHGAPYSVHHLDKTGSEQKSSSALYLVNQGGKVLFTVKQRSNHPPPLYQRTSQQQAKNCPPSIATLKKVQNMKYAPVPKLFTINTDRQLRQTFSTEAPGPSPQVFVLSAYYIVPENSKPLKTE